MADSELGELRRPPRLLEHRIERLSRHRGFGLAGGSSDALLPVDATDDVLAGAGGDDGGGEVAAPEWYSDTRSLTSVSIATVALSFAPIEHSEVVRLNGITLTPDVDYTIAGTLLTLLDLTNLRKGIGAATWTLVVSYAYYESTAFASPTVSGWTYNGSAAGPANGTLTTTTHEAGSMVCGPVPEGWNTITFYGYLKMEADADGIAFALLDPDLYDLTYVGDTGDQVGLYSSPARTNDGYAAVYCSTYWSHTTKYVSSNAAGTAGNSQDLGIIIPNNDSATNHSFIAVFTATTAGRATVEFTVDGVTYGVSAADLYVPDSPLIMISGATETIGGLQRVDSMDILVT